MPAELRPGPMMDLDHNNADLHALPPCESTGCLQLLLPNYIFARAISLSKETFARHVSSRHKSDRQQTPEASPVRSTASLPKRQSEVIQGLHAPVVLRLYSPSLHSDFAAPSQTHTYLVTEVSMAVAQLMRN